MRHGTIIEMHGTPAMGSFPAVAPERGRIRRARTRKGEGIPGEGWHIVEFEAGGALCVHESRFRIISNR